MWIRREGKIDFVSTGKKQSNQYFTAQKYRQCLPKQMDQYKCYIEALPGNDVKKKNRHQQIQIATVSKWSRSLNAHFHTRPPRERDRWKTMAYISMGNWRQSVLFISCLSNTQWWRELVVVYKRYALDFGFFLHLLLRTLALFVAEYICVYVFLEGWRTKIAHRIAEP